MDICEIFAEFLVEFHEVAPVGLAHNTGKCRVEEAIRDVFNSESRAICWCSAQTQSLIASSI